MPPSTITATERLYLTADRKRVVPAGHKDAATLYATPGTRIPMSAVEKFGLNEKGMPKKGGAKKVPDPSDGGAPSGDGGEGGKASGGDGKSGQEGGNKQGDKGADKSGQKGGNKGASKPGLTVKKAAKKAAAQGASGS